MHGSDLLLEYEQFVERFGADCQVYWQGAERRIARDGVFYAQWEFMRYYGDNDGRWYWDEAALSTQYALADHLYPGTPPCEVSDDEEIRPGRFEVVSCMLDGSEWRAQADGTCNVGWLRYQLAHYLQRPINMLRLVRHGRVLEQDACMLSDILDGSDEAADGNRIQVIIVNQGPLYPSQQ